jgi:hypothetical protein
MNLFPLSRCASATKIVCPLESTVATQPQLQPALLRLSAMTSQNFTFYRQTPRVERNRAFQLASRIQHGSTLGFRHSQWPDVSPGIQAQRRKRRERPSLRWGLISNYSRRATGSTRATGSLAVISSSRLIFVFSVSWTSRLFSDVKLLTACHRSFHTGWSFLCARVIVCPRAVVPMRRLDRGSS